MSCAVAIFVKTPGLSPIKSRLADTIGVAEAEQFYRLSLACVIEAVKLAGLQLVYAVAEPDGLYDELWKFNERIWSGEAALGPKMRRVHEALRVKYDTVLLTGADIPALSPQILRAAARESRLGHVIGPATDGGFYLYGSNRSIPAEAWAAPRWGTEHALADFEPSLDENVLKLQTLSDIDDFDALKRLVRNGDSLRRPTQRKLIDWAQATLGPEL